MICTLCHLGIGTDYADDAQYGIVHGQCYERISMKRINHTMTDPNSIYKATFAELTALLGRPPISTDAGWVALHDEYKKAWGPAEETVRAPRARSPYVGDEEVNGPVPVWVLSDGDERPREESGAPDGQAPRAGSVAARGGGPLHRPWRDPLSGPGISRTASGAETAGTRVDASPRLYQGGRGPNGGVLAVCEACGKVWEREKRRGRPSLLCGECR